MFSEVLTLMCDRGRVSVSHLLFFVADRKGILMGEEQNTGLGLGLSVC